MTRVLYDRAPPGEDANKSPEDEADAGHEAGSKKDEPRYDPESPELRSFFRGSWVEFPDASSSSRVMKARCVVSNSYLPSPLFFFWLHRPTVLVKITSNRRRENEPLRQPRCNPIQRAPCKTCPPRLPNQQRRTQTRPWKAMMGPSILLPST